MEYEPMIQSVLDEIDKRITDDIQDDELARTAMYSVYHFRRVFMELTGTPVMSYVTRRKLEHALYDLAQGKRIIDVAMEYGFETHAGFTKAFKKCYGFPPSLHRLHIMAKPPERATIADVKLKHGGIDMTPYIIEMTPFTVAGRTNRQKIANVKRTADIPAFDFDPRAKAGDLLDNTNALFPKSKHCEVEMCYDVDENNGEFLYFVGRGITHPDDLKNILPDMVTYEIKGLYAIFSTPLVREQKDFEQAIRETWDYILTKWLPNSEFEYDETRKDYEYHDYRAHRWFFDGQRQSDICIPIRMREETKRKARETDLEFWEDEVKLRGQR